MASIFHRLRPPEKPVSTPVEDARLVVLAQVDQHVFAAIYDRHFAGIYGYCYRSLGTVERAEDAAQQVFAQALAALPEYRESGRFRSWLYTIAHHVIHAHSRKKNLSTRRSRLGPEDDSNYHRELFARCLDHGGTGRLGASSASMEDLTSTNSFTWLFG